MLRVVAVVEAEEVVDASVVAGGTARGVFPVSLQGAQCETGEIAGKIDGQKKRGARAARTDHRPRTSAVSMQRCFETRKRHSMPA